MKCIFIALLAFVASICLGQKFRTERFDVEYSIQRDRTVVAEERITVVFMEKQRGLVRTLPFRTRSETNVRHVRYELIGATIDGRRTGFNSSVEGDMARFQIGRSNEWVDGRRTIAIQYRIDGALTDIGIGQQDPSDDIGPRTEFFWNVLPLRWSTSIPASKVTIKYPNPNGKPYAARILFGPQGDRAGFQLNSNGVKVGRTDRVDGRFVDPTLLEFSIKKPKPPGWTATVILSLPADAVDRGDAEINPIEQADSESPTPKSLTELPEIPSKPWGLIIPAIPAAALALLRRKPATRPLVVRYDPPSGVNAPDVGVIDDGKFDPRDLLAGVVTIAQKGHWKLESHGGSTSIDLTSASRTVPLDEFEQKLYDEFALHGPRVDSETLKDSFGEAFVRLEGAIQARHRERKWDEGSTVAKTCVGCLLIGGAVPCAFILVPFVGFWSCLGVPLAALLGWLGLSNWSTLHQPGEQVRWELRGFREFISRAHTKELNWIAERHPDQAFFEELLPYAIAFGLVSQWSRAFEGIQFQQPEWLVGTDPYFFAHSMAYSTWADGFSQEWGTATSEATASYLESISTSGGGFSDGGSGFGTGGFGGSDWNDSGGSDGGGGFDSGGSSGDGGGGGGGDSW